MRVIISGGGTGGHIFPAIAIANALKAADANTELLFVGAEGKMEMEKVPQAGYKIHGLWIAGFQRGKIMENLALPIKILNSLFSSFAIIRKFKPDVVVGVGGYASMAVVFMAQMMRIPTVLQEQNGYAGMTNKFLAKRAARICTAYAQCEQFFPKDKITLTGNPVRQDIVTIANKHIEGCYEYQLDPLKKTILVIGGSLGAKTINESINASYDMFNEQQEDIQVLWQTGKNNLDSYLKQPVAKLPNVKILPFLAKMDLAYAAADVVISRAGALSISELCLVGKPVILVPSPNVTDDHQTKNAEALVAQNAAILIKDVDCQAVLMQNVISLLQNKEACKNLSTNISSLAKPTAAQDIATVIINSKK
ncbi:MAG: undecaprenyldiphospho-muramoylpentapeptide beta-N-acetylglucosaminyltransferase [Bacteroidota bacterium]|jgi:UDP-N-acetylglucosamine--N-acetylmuramyl-(pentapeptide) pyrophosphoryl-undecaprenol N-acetylglucosamine transferase